MCGKMSSLLYSLPPLFSPNYLSLLKTETLLGNKLGDPSDSAEVGIQYGVGLYPSLRATER